MKFAYADPPYHRMGKKLYGNQHDQAAIWDKQETHIALINNLSNNYPDGWALSCNPKDLIWLLPHAPADTRIGVWVKTWHQIRPTSTQYAWEPVLWRTTKKDAKRPMIRDWIIGPATRQTGTPGAKPHYFNQWILNLLIFDHDADTIDDLFPGSGGMKNAINTPELFR